MSDSEQKPLRGLAALSAERRHEIAIIGGASVPPDKRSFSTIDGLAQAAGRIGGKNSGGNFKNSRERAVEAGRKGGLVKRGSFGRCGADNKKQK